MTRLPQIELQRIYHRKQTRIGLKFAYNEQLISTIRTLPRANWSQTKRLWYVDDTQQNLDLIIRTFQNKAVINDYPYHHTPNLIAPPIRPKRSLSADQKKLLNGFYNYLKGKRYSQSTIDTYANMVADFIDFEGKKPLDTLTHRDVELYIESVFIARNYSVSTQRQFISALKLFIRYEPSTLIDDLKLERPKRDKKLPVVLSQIEVIKLISYSKNLKHRVIIALLYSAGLRISELINLKLEDLHITRRQIVVRKGKGRKDRFVTLSENFLPLLQNYLKTYRPTLYFVEGQTAEQYTAGSVRKFIHKYSKACGIKLKVTPHTLRHSYATHLLENGVGLRHIQELLGHSKPETTMIYTHVARKDLLAIKSPLDYAIDELKKIDNNDQKFLLSGE